MTRRELLSLGALAVPASAQMRAVTPDGVRALPRARLSGLPYNASFVNVAAAAGLRAPVIWGVEGRADYILESMGCGVAFLDYDNDGWQDILVLTGQHLAASTKEPTPAGAIIRLYHNNRDGTFTDVTARSGLGAPCGLPGSPSPIITTTASKIFSSPAGARTFCTTITATARLPMSPRRRDSSRPARAMEQAARGSITIVTDSSICLFPLSGVRSGEDPAAG